MKFAGILCVFLAASGMGIYGSMELKRRKRQLFTLKQGLISLEREIEYQVFSLPEAFLHTAERTKEPWNLFFSGIGTRLKNQGGAFCEVRDIIEEELAHMKHSHPWKEDLDMLAALGNGLGDLDKNMQLVQILSVKEELEKRILEAEAEEKQKGHLYQSLGICMGVLGVILLL